MIYAQWNHHEGMQGGKGIRNGPQLTFLTWQHIFIQCHHNSQIGRKCKEYDTRSLRFNTITSFQQGHTKFKNLDSIISAMRSSDNKNQ